MNRGSPVPCSSAGKELEGIFHPGRIGTLLLPNRIVRSATNEGLADPEGRVGRRYVDFLGRLASGGMGLIVTGHLFVREEGRASIRQGGIHNDAAIPGLRQAVRRVHDEGMRIVAQISHCGGQARPREAGVPGTVAPSAVPDPAYRQVPGELSVEEIRGIVGSFAAAAERAREAGFDGVAAARGARVPAESIPLAAPECADGCVRRVPCGRARIVLEICESVRRSVGPTYPVLVKINGEDSVDGGLESADARGVATMLAAAGIDAIEVSGGLPSSREPSISRKEISSVGEEGYFLPHAEAVKSDTHVPVISVGGFRSPDFTNRVLRSGTIDFVAMSRPPRPRTRAGESLVAGGPAAGHVHLLQHVHPGQQNGRRGSLRCRPERGRRCVSLDGC